MIVWEDGKKRLDAEATATGDPTGWFEKLHAAGAAGRTTMAWSRTEPPMPNATRATLVRADPRAFAVWAR